MIACYILLTSSYLGAPIYINAKEVHSVDEANEKTWIHYGTYQVLNTSVAEKASEVMKKIKECK